MEFRWYIGKTVDGSVNLIDFSNPADWVDLSGGNFTLNPNYFRHTFGLIDAIETVNDIFTIGEEYYITYDTVDNTGGGTRVFVRPYAGDFTVTKYETNPNVGFGNKLIEKYFVRLGNKLRFVVGDDVTLNDLFVYPYVWNAVLENEDTPSITQDSVYEIKRSERIVSSGVNSLQGVTFFGTSYTAQGI